MEVFLKDLLVVGEVRRPAGLFLRHVHLIIFAIQIVLVELKHPVFQLFVLLVLELAVGASVVPWVERVVPHHIFKGLGQRVLFVLGHCIRHEGVMARHKR